MGRMETREQLQQLLALLQQERRLAKDLDMAGLEKVVAAKQQLLTGLQVVPEDVDEVRDLLKQIDYENRRNAFLLWTGLNWVRELMGFFGNAAMPQIYGQRGASRTLTQGGRLLSGKV